VGGTVFFFVFFPGGVAGIGAKRPGPGEPREGAYVDVMADADESPPMDVVLDPFFISKFEMTHQQWGRARGRGNVRLLRAGYQEFPAPVAAVTWINGAEAVARVGLELPTEAQWEYAARAGTSTPWWTGSDPSSLSGAAVFSSERIELVNGRRPNAFGLHDVAGNVAEWCRDGYSVLRSCAPGAGEYPADKLALRVLRGGGAHDDAGRVRSSVRTETNPTNGTAWSGLRPSRRVDP
jgi:formylglycine-generating enzyme required for sulfatase activity